MPVVVGRGDEIEALSVSRAMRRAFKAPDPEALEDRAWTKSRGAESSGTSPECVVHCQLVRRRALAAHNGVDFY